MIHELTFIIGTSSRCQEFANLCAGRVATLSHEYDRPFHAVARLDVEFAAVTLFELKHPEANPLAVRNAAGVHHVRSEAFARTVITAPLIHQETLGSMVASLARVREASGLPGLSDRELADRIAWSLMFDALRTVVSAPDCPSAIRVGFHCETIGFFKSTGTELFRSFIESYTGLMGELSAANVSVH